MLFPTTSLLAFCLSFSSILRPAACQGAAQAAEKLRYLKSHSLGNDYEFDPRDGWTTVNITGAQFTPSLGAQPEHGQFVSRDISSYTQDYTRDLTGDVEKVVDNVWNGLKAIGDPQSVTITWYTGHDLLNPSCWSQGNWSPSDGSFVAALTLDGWDNRPKCFDFLELCNSPKKCVFVRVVDTCAGCAAGSRHVDLTRAAFGELAAYSEGVLTVQMRSATRPDTWYEDMWGPKD